jgi:hypothetical protein
MGVHRTSGTYEGKAFSHPQHYSVAFMRDDVGATMDKLADKGAEFTGPVHDFDFGLGTNLKMPGAGRDPALRAQTSGAHSL